VFKIHLKKANIINYLLIILIFLAALLFSRDIISIAFSKSEFPTMKTSDKTTINSIPEVKDIMNYASIVEKNPFGLPMKFRPINTRSTTNRQGSLSELILVGTATGPKNLSYAIFADKTQPAPVRQEVFAYGEDVYGYGTLSKIEIGLAEITQGANIYTIPLADIQIEERHTTSAATSQLQFVKKINERQYVLDQRKVQQALNNPEQILTDARLLPNIQNGKQEGFRMLEVKQGGLYDSLGLKNNDILLRINELELSNPEVAMQAMSALRGMNRVKLDIIRNGTKMTLTYQIK